MAICIKDGHWTKVYVNSTFDMHCLEKISVKRGKKYLQPFWWKHCCISGNFRNVLFCFHNELFP